MCRYRRDRVTCVADNEDGSSLVEMSVSLAILLVVMLGVIQFSYGLYAANVVSDAAREAARWAMVRGNTSCTNTPNLSKCGATPTDIQTYVRGLMFPGLVPANFTVSTTWLGASASIPASWTACGTTSGCKAPGNMVSVSVTYAFPLTLPSWNNWRISFVSSTLNISSTATVILTQ